MRRHAAERLPCGLATVATRTKYGGLLERNGLPNLAANRIEHIANQGDDGKVRI